MKTFYKIALAITFFFSSFSFASQISQQQKVYLNTNDIAFDGQAIYVHLDDEWVKTNAIRSDMQGFYLLGDDLSDCGSRVSLPPKKWQCPYCRRWWEFGKECENEECPTNQWKQKKEENEQ